MLAELADQAETQRQIQLFPGTPAQLGWTPVSPGGIGYRYRPLPNRCVQAPVSLPSDIGEELLSVPDDAGLTLLLESPLGPLEDHTRNGQSRPFLCMFTQLLHEYVPSNAKGG